MTREEIISRIKELNTDGEKLKFEENYLNFSYEDKEKNRRGSNTVY